MFSAVAHSFIHFWHAPVRVRSAKRRHQSPEWAILSQVDCFIQGEVKWFQVLLESLHPRGARASSSSRGWEAVKIFLAFALFGRCTLWPNRKRRHAWTMAERGRWVARLSHLTSLFHTRFYHLVGGRKQNVTQQCRNVVLTKILSQVWLKIFWKSGPWYMQTHFDEPSNHQSSED